MRRLLILFLMVTSCGKEERPKDVLSESQLSALLVDVYLGESRTESVPVPRDSSMRYYLPFEQKLFKRRGISDTVMMKTYEYYLGHPRELEHVYDSVIDTLSLREQRSDKHEGNVTPLKAAPKKEVPKKDLPAKKDVIKKKGPQKAPKRNIYDKKKDHPKKKNVI